MGNFGETIWAQELASGILPAFTQFNFMESKLTFSVIRAATWSPLKSRPGPESHV